MAANRSAMKDASLAALSGQRGGRSESMDEMAAAMFGDIKRGDGARITAAPINIYLIHPDATQPRRALPTEVRRAWDGSPTSLPALFMEWMKAIDGWRSLIVSILNGEEVERPEIVQPLTGALVEIADLAASIRRDGLTNPITVVRRGEEYIIETGERRWLAYHLLVAHTGDDSWTKIPARVVEQFNRWRQAAENNTRQDLNAIGKARQLAVLLMELLRDVHEFMPLEDFEHEQDFYAQVADGETFKTPRGKGEVLLNAMGLKNAVQLRQYRALLRLPRDVWDEADDDDWAEQRIRAFMQGDTVTIVTVDESENLSQAPEKPPVGIKKPPALSAEQITTMEIRGMVTGLTERVGKVRGDSECRRELRDLLESALRMLDGWDKLGGQGDD